VKALEHPPTPSTEEAHKPPTARSDQIAHAVALAVLFAVPALICLHMAVVSDADVWLHMRTGQWILDHHAIPHTDAFSRSGAGKPWAAYSWIFDVLIFKCFERFNLLGLVAYSTAMVVALTVAVYHLIKRLQADFSVAALITFVAGYSLMRLYTPRSWLFSILFFTLQLDILMHARRTGPKNGAKPRELLWLPLIYALWANVHIQFFDGLIVLAIATGEAILSRWWTRARSRISPSWLGGTFLACILASCINPYGWNIFLVGYRAAAQPGVLYFIAEFHALEFRMLADYCMLFLALAAAAALAWRSAEPQSDDNRFPLFETVLLIFAAVVSFRTGRDMWVMVICASAILAQSIRVGGGKKHSAASFTIPITALVVGLMVFLGALAMRVNNARLRIQLADHMPVRATEIVRNSNYAGPLYNNYDWGDYLIWDLHMPVSIDGRTDLNGDKLISRSLATWNGAPDWASDPDLQSAGLVIGPVTAPLTQLLRTDPRFQLAYEDKLAAVFIARRLGEQPATSSATH
jgi:hypothetical protein